MIKKFIVFFLVILTLNFSQFVQATILLDGKSLTPHMIAKIADGETVSISPEAMKKVKQSNQVLIKIAESGFKIYGLTVGVGLNKDRPMVDVQGKLTQELIDASKVFNKRLLYAHSGGIGEPMSIRMARATMAVRLNGFLNGGAGVQPEIVDAYVAFLNKGITPLIPSRGSIGQGDITVISHIGLAMMGESKVYYQGEIVDASVALTDSHTPIIIPFAKDALSILSSNAYSAAEGALALDSAEQLLRVNQLSYVLSLQALNGNISPFLENTLALRPYPEVVTMGKTLREQLAGSSLWKYDETRPLQDPLSFRSGVYLLAELQRSYQQAYDQLFIQLNSSDDNPGVILNVAPLSQHDQETVGYINDGDMRGAVLPSANFDPLPWVLSFEHFGIAMAHNSLAIAQQIIKLNEPKFTGLTRYLGTENTVHAFGAMEKPAIMLAMRNKELSMPVSMDYFSVAGGIEDIATNAPSVVERVQQQIDNSYQLLGILLVHSTQAVDLRKQHSSHFMLSKSTDELYTAIRNNVSFVNLDRPLAPDFSIAAEVLREFGN